jgi:hypothetical protein
MIVFTPHQEINMTTVANDRIGRTLTEGANSIRSDWSWFLALGIVQISA